MEEEELTSSEVLAYDEPDTHLDYASQRALFDILNRQARLPQAQVLIATHSLNFIDRVPLLSILHFRLDKDLKTNVQTLLNPTHEEEQRFLASVCSGLGLRNSVLLDERCFLIVEGETEESALPKLFHHATEESLTTAGITLFSTRGCGAARRLVEVLATQWGRQVVLLVDKDTHGDHAGGISDAWLSSVNLKYGDGAYFIGTAEFEDAFSDEVWARALQAYFPPRDGGSNWSPADIAGIRRSGKKFSAELCAAVGRRCKASVGKPDLGLALAETCKAIQDMPAVLLSCFDFAMKKARH